MLLRRMLLHQLQHDFDGLLELAVAALPVRGRIEIDLDIGRDAVVLDLPLAVESIDRRARRHDDAAVEQFGITADADQPAPRARSDQGTDAGLAEIPRERVTT